MSYPYSNYNSDPNWDKSSGTNQSRPGQSQPNPQEAFQELLKFQQQQQQGSNNPGHHQPYNPAQPGQNPNSNYSGTGAPASNVTALDQNTLAYLKQKLASTMPPAQPQGPNNYSQDPRHSQNQGPPPYNNLQQGPSHPSRPPYGGGPPYPPYDSSGNQAGRYGGPPPHQPSYQNSGPNYPRNGPYNDASRNGPPPSYPGPRNGPPGQYDAGPPRGGPGNYSGRGNHGPPQGHPPYHPPDHSRPFNPQNVPPTIGTMTSPFSKAGGGGNSGFGNKSKGGHRRHDRRHDRNPKHRDNRGGKQDKDRRSDSRTEPALREKSPRGKRKELSPPTSRARDDRERRSTSSFQYCLSSPRVDILQLRQRYKKMKIPKDFAAAERIWPNDQAEGSLNEIPSDFCVPFSCQAKVQNDSTLQNLLESNERSKASDNCFYSSKILLYAGREAQSTKTPHASNTYRFIVGKKDRCELFCIGGSWSAEIDGGDPAVDRSILTKTAIRHCKEFCGLDLTDCSWMHFLEIQYQRVDCREISVIFIPRIWELSVEEIRSRAIVEEDDENDDKNSEQNESSSVPDPAKQDEADISPVNSPSPQNSGNEDPNTPPTPCDDENINENVNENENEKEKENENINEKETEKEKETDDPMEIQDTETETKKETECADKAAGASEET
eukprot:CAMPEP_0117032852 /NCGR_PEP_ID=MMETSP0472-20121206/23519_1 /TAXON_ID=693140 ORGANISM="Tiarina fusus, Strain LIS" /NCGR_SAMPLE_ID=MMETSP0472 /ASSEMBLY_ACC=CAM_ASM_000603 /LENGTH=663 /DNA_ID=CAMNT_0004741609 /DNA_START=12 /DNA_END=1999 /DNA_ORIENTATION=+